MSVSKLSSKTRSSIQSSAFVQSAQALSTPAWHQAVSKYQEEKKEAWTQEHVMAMELQTLLTKQQEARSRWLQTENETVLLMGLPLHGSWVFKNPKAKEKWIEQWTTALNDDWQVHFHSESSRWNAYFFKQSIPYIDVLFQHYDALSPEDPQISLKQQIILEVLWKAPLERPTMYDYRTPRGAAVRTLYAPGFSHEQLKDTIAQSIHPEWLKRFQSWMGSNPSLEQHQIALEWGDAWIAKTHANLDIRLPIALWFKHLLPASHHPHVQSWIGQCRSTQPYATVSTSTYKRWTDDADGPWVHEALTASLSRRTQELGLLTVAKHWKEDSVHQSKKFCSEGLKEDWFEKAWNDPSIYQKTFQRIQSISLPAFFDFLLHLYEPSVHGPRLLKQFNLFEHLPTTDQSIWWNFCWKSLLQTQDADMRRWLINIPSGIQKGWWAASFAWDAQQTQKNALELLKRCAKLRVSNSQEHKQYQSCVESILKAIEQHQPDLLTTPLSQVSEAVKTKSSKISEPPTTLSVFDTYKSFLSPDTQAALQQRLLKKSFTSNDPASSTTQTVPKKRL